MEYDLIGRQLGNFRVEYLLGRGGMATVYYSWDVKLERPAAIKVIDARYRDSLSHAERFVHEAQAVAKWRHENVVQVYYADEEDGLYYFAMEYIDGMDLGELLGQYAADGELMTYEDVLLVARAVANALDYAHERGVIHRDVKPSNVMVTGKGRVVLTDFGLALDLDRGTIGEVLGSPHYIAPEQARSSADAVPQSDLYSLGVMLYEMLTGAVPFDDPSPTSILLQHMTKLPRPPREINPMLSAEAEMVILKALNKDPQGRYQSGRELICALEKVLVARETILILEEEESRPPISVEGSSPCVRPPSETSASERVSRHSSAPIEPVSEAPARRAADSLVGVQLGEYCLEALLGREGRACTYRALDVQLGHPVTIQVIEAPAGLDAEYEARFEHRAQAIADLEHPYLVELHGYGATEGLLYVAGQCVEGTDLGAMLAQRRASGAFIAPEEASRVIRHICLALDYAHSQGVVHREVKPSQVVLDQQGQAYLAGFGFALLTEFGIQDEIFNSAYYVAPEQAVSSTNAVPQSDLYAVGVILYEMFTGVVPFDDPDPLEVVMLHMSTAPCPPRQLRADISPELEAVILRALAKEPTERYQSGTALADALERALEAAPMEEPIALGQPPVDSPSPEHLEASDGMELGEWAPIAAASAAPQPASEGVGSTVIGSSSPGALERGRRLVPYAFIAIPVCLFMSALLGAGGLLARRTLANVMPWSRPAENTTGMDRGSVTPAAAWTDAPTLTPGSGANATATRAPLSTPALAAQTLPATSTRAATATFTSLPSATPSPTQLPTSAKVPTVVPTPTRTPSPTPAATPTSRPTRTPPPLPVYELRLAAQGEDSLLLVNEGTAPFPLAPLRLGDGKGAIDGAEWGVQALDRGKCVAVWKEEGKPKQPKVECDQIGKSLTRKKSVRFWKASFKVYYNKKLVGTCSAKPIECLISIPR